MGLFSKKKKDSKISLTHSKKETAEVIETLVPEWYKTYQGLGDMTPDSAMITSSVVKISAQMRESLKEYVRSVMPEPSSSYKIYQQLNREDIEANEVAQLVASDPLLAAKVLKTVNSAAFGFTSEVTSFGRAVTLMGFRSIRSMVLAQSLKESMSDSEEDQEFSEKIRMHSSMVSAIAQHICKNSKSVDQSDVATIGLLHDIGKILNARMEQSGKTIHVKHAIPTLVLEGIIASVFAELWELPEFLVRALEYLPYPLHYSSGSVSDDLVELVTFVQAANYIVNAIGMVDGGEHLSLGEEYLQAASLPNHPSEWIVPAMVTEIEKSRSSLV